jgi:hypothetical protein
MAEKQSGIPLNLSMFSLLRILRFSQTQPCRQTLSS